VDSPIRSVADDKRRYRSILFSIAFASFMVNLDTYIVNVSLPTVAAAFHTSTANVSWVSMAYQLTVTGFLLIFGRLGDRMSIKKIFMFGYGLFACSTLLCGLSNSLWTLVLFRAVQGVGASVLYALTPAMVPRFLPDSMRGPAFGTLATAAALGVMIGNPIGGVITGYLSWQWIFYLNFPVGVIAMLVCWKVIPDDGAVRAAERRRIDLPAALLSFLFLLGLMYSLNRVNEYGWRSPLLLGSLAVTLVMLAAFVIREHSTTSPLLDYSLFRSRAFSSGNVANFLAYAFLAGNNFIIPFYLIIVKGLTPEKAGLALLVYSLVYVWVGPLAGHLSKKIHPRNLCTASLALGALLSLAFSFLLRMQGLVPILCYFVLLAITFATFLPSNNNVIMAMAPENRQGLVSASFRMVGRIGMTFGVCLFETIFSMMIPHAGKSSVTTLKTVSGTTLLDAFSRIYLVGSAIFVLALVFSWLARDRTA
jgi:EmrB/QacA subfamily drug resistance transporter